MQSIFYFYIENLVLCTGQSFLALPEELLQEFEVN
jgi:hypothetical protein